MSRPSSRARRQARDAKHFAGFPEYARPPKRRRRHQPTQPGPQAA